MSKFNLTGQLQLQQPKNLQSTLKRIQDYFSNIGVNVHVRTNARNIREASSAIGLVNTEAIAATKSTSELGRTLGIAARRFGAISIATGTFLGLVRGIKSAVSEAIDFDRELNKITQATGATDRALKKVRDRVFDLSTSLGVSSKELVVSARTLAQAGITAEKAADALKILAQTDLAATFGTIEDTTEGAIAIIAQFGKEATKNGKEIKFLEDSLDSINSVSKAFAVESQDIIAAVRKTGGSFEAAGGNLNELIALFTSVRATTRESADTIATAFRTIFTRIQRTDTIDALRELGIQLQDTEGKFVKPLQAIENLAVGLSVLDKRDYRFTQIIEELGGIRQIGKVIPLLKEYSVTQQALNVALNSSGSTAKDAETAQQSLAVQLKKVREEFQALVQSFVSSDIFKTYSEGALLFASALIKVADSLQPILYSLSILAAVKLGAGLRSAVTSFAFGSGQKRNAGGPIHRFASGGTVPGSGNTDSVPAMLTPGEFVIRKSSVNKLGAQNLQKLNKGGPIKDQSSVAALILASSGNVGSSPGINVTEKDLLNKARKRRQGLPSSLRGFSKKYAYSKAGLHEEGLASNLRTQITRGIATSIEDISSTLESSGIQGFKIPKGSLSNLSKSLGNDATGGVFEALIKGIKDPRFTDNQKTANFDFRGGLGEAEKLFSPDTTSSYYREAKGSISAAKGSEIKSKILNTLLDQAMGDITSSKANIDTSKKEQTKDLTGTITKRQAAALFFGKSVAALSNSEFNVKNNTLLEDLQGKYTDYNITSNKQTGQFTFTKRQGFAIGGEARGTDKVPAMLTPGEFVVNKATAQKVGYGRLQRLNKTGDTQYLAKGGIVGGDGTAEDLISQDKLERAVKKALTNIGLESAGLRRGSGTVKKSGDGDSNDVIRALEKMGDFASAEKISSDAYENRVNAARDRSNNTSAARRAPTKSERAAEGLGIADVKNRTSGDFSTARNFADRFNAAQKPTSSNIPGLNQSDLGALSKFMPDLEDSLFNDLTKAVQDNVKVQTEAVKETKANTVATKTKNVKTNSGEIGDKPNDEVKKTSGFLSQSAIFMGIALLSAADQLGLFGKAADEAATRALTFGATVYGIGSTLIGSLGDLKGFGAGLSRLGQYLPTVTGLFSGLGTVVGKTIPGISGFGNQLTKNFGGAAGAAVVLQGALIGLAGGMAVIEYMAASAEKRRENANSATDAALKGTREKGANNFAIIERSLLEASKADAKARNTRSNGNVGIGAGIAAGAGAGAVIGSFVGPLGTAIGAAIGAAIGGIGGAFVGGKTATDNLSNPEVIAAKQSALAQYTAAKASYDFANALDLAKKKNLTGVPAIENLVKATNDLDVAQRKATQASGRAQFNRNNLSTSRVSSFGALLGYKPELNDQEKKQAENEKAGLEELARQRQEAATQLRAATDQSVGDYLATAQSATTLGEALKNSGADKAMESYRQTLISLNGNEQEANEVIKAQTELYKKQVEAANDNLNRQAALIAAKEAEVALILKTNAALNSLVQSSRDFQVAQNNLDRSLASLAGEAKSIPLAFGNAFDNIARVGDVKQFANLANQAAAPLGRGGQDIANRVSSSADAIQKLRTGLNIETLENAKKTNKLDGESGRSAAQQLISGIIGEGTFKNLGPDLQKGLISEIQKAGGKTQINQELIDNILGQFEKSAQTQADVLKQTVELTNQYLAQYDQVSNAVITAMNKEVDLRVGMVDIVQRGQDRMAEAFEGRITERQQQGILAQKDANRLQAAQTSLGPNVKGVFAGNVKSLSNGLSDIRNNRAANDKLLQNDSITPQQRGALELENKKLADSASKVTAELKRLTDQSEKASDIMGQIGKERAKREFVKGEAENFVLGTQSERASQMQVYQGANVVAQTGSFQALPEEMRKTVSDLLKQIGDLEPGGMADQVRRGALKNDYMAAGLPPQLAEALANDRSTSKEEQLINDLRTLNQQEKAAQDALIAIEKENTQTVTQLLAGVNQLINVISQNFANNMPKAQGFATGGSVFKPRGTDTIPAMLSPGEFVMRKEAVSKYGVGFMSSINGGNAPAGYANGGAVYRRRGGSISAGGGNMFESLPQMLNAGLSGLTQSLSLLTQGLSNIHMTHDVNINGQINVGGLNVAAVADAIKSSVGNYVVSVVTKELDNRSNKFRAG